MQFNPLRWKRQHLVAAIGFVVLGAIAGFFLGAYFAELKVGNLYQQYRTLDVGLVADHVRLRLQLTWSAAGAVLTALGIYCAQMMRA